MYSCYLNLIISNKYFDSYKLFMTLTINLYYPRFTSLNLSKKDHT